MKKPTLSGLAITLTLCACGSAIRVAALDDMERMRVGASAAEGAALAPDIYARGERERDLARAEHAGGDDVAAALHAEHAMAEYTHAIVASRIARAASELDAAQQAADDATTQQTALEATRARFESEAADLEARARLARERLLPAASAPGSLEREAARRVAARSLVVEARILCAAAGLVRAMLDGDAGPPLDDDWATAFAASTEGARALEVRLDQAPSGPTPIDDAASARTRCLDLLSRARRASEPSQTGQTDALLAELSASGGWEPTRDERGVAVALRGAYRGAELTDQAKAKMAELGRVSAAHSWFGVLVVVHDATQPAPKDDTDSRRADTAVQALVAAGAPSGRVVSQLAGARAPIADPADARERQRNERVEIVFVGR